MSANVETMFSVREVPWHGLGTIVQEAPNSKEALKLAGLDWTVDTTEVFDNNNHKIPGYFATRRTTDQKILGIVSGRYKVVQNSEAFEFTDELIGGDIRYETAGSLRDGKQIWLLAKMPETKILGDDVTPYICFTNGHDGLSSIRVCMTPVRVVCNNTLNLALNTAKRSWSAKHIGNIDDKLDEARRTLGLAEHYMEELASTADDLANTSLTTLQVEEFINELFPVEEDASDRIKQNAQILKDNFMVCYLAPDIQKFRNTAWGVVNAASDFSTHSKPRRATVNSQENKFSNILIGDVVIDKTFMNMMSRMITSKV